MVIFLLRDRFRPPLPASSKRNRVVTFPGRQRTGLTGRGRRRSAASQPAALPVDHSPLSIPTQRVMHTGNSITMYAPKDEIFEAAANLERWPAFLPHYRYI